MARAPAPVPVVVRTSAGSGHHTWHVSPTGSDAATGGLGDPWRTPARAARAVAPGDVVLLAAGSYPPFDVTKSGSAQAPIVFRSAPGQVATIDAAGADHGIGLERASFIVLAGLVVRGNGTQFGAAIDVQQSGDVTVVGSTMGPDRGFGIRLLDSWASLVQGCDIARNGTGVEVSGGGWDDVIEGNRIHDQDRMIINDAAPNNDRGAVGVSLYHTVGRVDVHDNSLWGNRAPSIDYGYDGGAFEIFGSSGATIRDNTIGPGNQDVMEVGTDGSPVRGDVFAGNVAADPTGTMEGIVLHAGEGLSIVGNVLYHPAGFAIALTGPDPFTGPRDGLTVLDNIMVAGDGSTVFSLGIPPPAASRVDHDLVRHEGGGSYARLSSVGGPVDLDAVRALTGFEDHGAAGDPGFADPGAGDFRLTSGSAAIGLGVGVPALGGGGGRVDAGPSGYGGSEPGARLPAAIGASAWSAPAGAG